MDSASTMSALPYVDGQGKLPKRIAPTGKRVTRAAYGHTTTSTSIPSRYRTVVYSNTEPRGFNSRAVRFPAPEINSNPGPGSYGVVHDRLEKTGATLSNRGAGGCATLRKRFSTMKLQAVGPGSYNPTPVENCRDFSHAGGTSIFQNPIAATVFDPKKQTPAPNAYTPRGLYNGGKNRLITGESVFKSKTLRADPILPELATRPCPTQYDVTDKILRRSSYSYKSVFKSKSQRTQKKSEKLPGPADYHVNTNSIGTLDSVATRKGLYNYKGKNALLISAPALPRCPSPISPGPGHYTNSDHYEEKERQAGAGAVFKSITGRWMSDSKVAKLQEEPGPGSYNPALDEKRSYFYNIYRKWV